MTAHFVIASLGFPAWLRITHFINLLFIGLLIRSGIQVLGAHPRLYWNDACNPDKAWLTLTKRKVPKDQLYTSMDDEVSPSSWIAQPGGQNLGLGAIVDPIRQGLLHRITSRQDYKPSDITSYFWVNGRPPVSDEFKRLQENYFADWKLEVFGLVTNPLHLSLEDLRKLPKQTQITLHNCIQGWSGIGEWGGVPLRYILELCGALPEARYLVFTSYQYEMQSYPHGGRETQETLFYEVIDMELARHPQSILAYEMNGKPLPLEHGAPLRLRVETQLGYKMVKYLRSIELVTDYSHIGKGRGGFREDFQYYGRTAEI